MARTDLIAAAQTNDPNAAKAAKAKSSGEQPLPDADAQFRILNPETMAYDLLIPVAVERRIEKQKRVKGKVVAETVIESGYDVVRKTLQIPTQFTLGDIVKRRIFDEVAQFRKRVFLELRECGVDMSDPTPTRISVAFASPNVREPLRQLIASIARYEDGSHPTPDDIAAGMSDVDYDTITLWLCNRISAEQDSQKKARAAARPSA